MRFPVVKKTEATADGLRLTLEMVPELDWFSGHFDQVGILPGVAMCVFVQEFTTRYLNFDLYASFTDLVQAKFLKTIMAGETVELTITPTMESQVVNFSAVSNGTLCASGRLGFNPQYLNDAT